MTSRRNQAKLAIRIDHLSRQLQAGNTPTWAYGVTQAPEYLSPLPMSAVTHIHTHASDTAYACLRQMERDLHDERRKADRLTETTREIYEEIEDSNFFMAERRLVAMTTQARAREPNAAN